MAIHSSCISVLCEAYQRFLIAGDRIATRQLVQRALEEGADAHDLINEMVWPTMEALQSSYRDDRLSVAQLNLASRLNRSVTDQLASLLRRQPLNGQSVLIFCGDDEPEELGGQICADLFEAAGYSVRFAGGGVPHDEALKFIGEFRPNLLVLFGTLPSGMPTARKLIDYLREVNSCPDMQVMCCGGIYKRASGLAEEIGADLCASNAAEAVRVVREHPTRRATVDQQTVGRTRRIRKAAARRAPEMVAEAA